ncbi:MAG: hemolysin III family protein [Candidatus Peribacteraceae bacterium]|nr:hemolysin III family protein [Candidatus Peribacteraceae bacterium]MDD5074819.1 hemolysin III family protein [Candidatus Peribacteraceae bacterium]
MRPDERRQTRAEETANSLIHLIGFGWGIAVLSLLVVSASAQGDPWRIVSFSIYGSCLVLMYGASSLYHAVPYSTFKRLMQRVDHATIFLLIAGTYTPFMLVPLRGGWGWSIFGVVWGIAMVGIGANGVLHRLSTLRVALYILLGWLILVAVVPLILTLPLTAVALLIAGGIAYTSGVFFFARDRLPFHHAVWHLFVLGGSVFHFFALVRALP